MLVEDVLKLGEGSVVELDKLAGDPVDVYVNERLVARGEVLVLNDNFCVRVTELLTGEDFEGLHRAPALLFMRDYCVHPAICNHLAARWPAPTAPGNAHPRPAHVVRKSPRPLSPASGSSNA